MGLDILRAGDSSYDEWEGNHRNATGQRWIVAGTKLYGFLRNSVQVWRFAPGWIGQVVAFSSYPTQTGPLETILFFGNSFLRFRNVNVYST